MLSSFEVNNLEHFLKRFPTIFQFTGFWFFSFQQLYEAVSREDLPLCILLLAYSTPQDVNTINDDKDKLTALHCSCLLGNIVITQLLIWVSIMVVGTRDGGVEIGSHISDGGGFDHLPNDGRGNNRWWQCLKCQWLLYCSSNLASI